MTGKRGAEAAESLGWDVGSDSHVFRAEIDELSIVRLNEERTKLIIESWEPAAVCKESSDSDRRRGVCCAP